MPSSTPWTWGRWWRTGKEAWRAAAHGVTKSWTQLSNWTTNSSPGGVCFSLFHSSPVQVLEVLQYQSSAPVQSSAVLQYPLFMFPSSAPSFIQVPYPASEQQNPEVHIYTMVIPNQTKACLLHLHHLFFFEGRGNLVFLCFLNGE